jgi:hypothetical protein
VYNDIYWQALAFDEGGLAEIEKHKDDLTPGQFEAWKKIAQGMKVKNDALINEGNMLLFRNEQEITLQKTVYHVYPGSFKQAGEYADNVVPHLTDDREFWSFKKHQPAGDFANFNDRWAWFSGPVWDDWLHVSNKKPTELQAEIKKLVVP